MSKEDNGGIKRHPPEKQGEYGDAWAKLSSYSLCRSSLAFDRTPRDQLGIVAPRKHCQGSWYHFGRGWRHGAFCKAYIQQFPAGIQGQTLIVSDLSAGMLDKARETTVMPANEISPQWIFSVLHTHEMVVEGKHGVVPKREHVEFYVHHSRKEIRG